MLHNFWFMDPKLFQMGCLQSQFYADYDEKISFPKFWVFQVNIPILSFDFFFSNFSKIAWAKISKFRFIGQFLTLKNMVTKFFQNSNFSDFLGIKSEISHLDKIKLNSQIFGNFWNLETDRFWVFSRVLEPKYCESIRSPYYNI